LCPNSYPSKARLQGKAKRARGGPWYHFGDGATYKLAWRANTPVHQDPETESGRSSTASSYQKTDDDCLPVSKDDGANCA